MTQKELVPSFEEWLKFMKQQNKVLLSIQKYDIKNSLVYDYLGLNFIYTYDSYTTYFLISKANSMQNSKDLADIKGYIHLLCKFRKSKCANFKNNSLQKYINIKKYIPVCKDNIINSIMDVKAKGITNYYNCLVDWYIYLHCDYYECEKVDISDAFSKRLLDIFISNIDDKLKFIRLLIEKLNVKKISNVGLRNLLGEEERKPVDDGLFLLDWNYVTFSEKMIFLYHPKYPNGEKGKYPLRVENDLSKKTFNYIKNYIKKKISPLRVVSKNCKIREIVDSINLENVVELFNYYNQFLQDTNSDKYGFVLKKGFNDIKKISPSVVKSALKIHKNKYIDYLSDMQIEDSRILLCQEAHVVSSNENTSIIPEDVFVFRIKDNNKRTIFVYENVLDSRSSVVFCVNKIFLEYALEEIIDYFSSTVIHKRSLLIDNRKDFSYCGVLNYKRVLHNSFEEWSKDIKYFMESCIYDD